MNEYNTSEVAKLINVHPNTIRLYEKWKLISDVKRSSNGYRIFTDFHVEQLKLARIAFKIEILQSGLRKLIIQAILSSANKNFKDALAYMGEYHDKIQKEQKNAEEAIEIVNQILENRIEKNNYHLTRKEVASYLDISVDTLRNWERNGLLFEVHKENGVCFYDDDNIKKLKIIKALRCSNYSLEAILRLFKTLEYNPTADLKNVLNTPLDDEDIISVCDKLIASLQLADRNALLIIEKLKYMEKVFS